MLLVRNRRFQKNINRARALNAERINKAQPLELPQLELLELTVLAEWETEEGYMGEPGVSYLFRTDLGSLLFDIGYGEQNGTLVHNAAKLGLSFDQVDALSISHLHRDHMGGGKAQRSRCVILPEEFGSPRGKPCFLPAESGAEGFTAEVLEGPRILTAGIASTGPLARSLFFFGWTEEQALLAKIKEKGLVIFTGCSHPTIEVVLEMVRRLSDEPIYAIGGGIHFPVTHGRGRYAGIQMHTLIGTGKPPWRRISDDDLTRTINSINSAGPKRVFLSAHDTCDHALHRLATELEAETELLKAGASYRL